MGVSSYWFSLDSHGDGEGYRPLTVEITLHRFFLLSNTCIHGSFSVVEHSDLESRLYISFVAFSLASRLLLPYSHWGKVGKIYGTNAMARMVHVDDMDMCIYEHLDLIAFAIGSWCWNR